MSLVLWTTFTVDTWFFANLHLPHLGRTEEMAAGQFTQSDCLALISDPDLRLVHPDVDDSAPAILGFCFENRIVEAKPSPAHQGDKDAQAFAAVSACITQQPSPLPTPTDPLFAPGHLMPDEATVSTPLPISPSPRF